MSLYEKIKNPETGRFVSIYGKLGQAVLRNYLEIYQYGGTANDANDANVTTNVNTPCFIKRDAWLAQKPVMCQTCLQLETDQQCSINNIDVIVDSPTSGISMVINNSTIVPDKDVSKKTPQEWANELAMVDMEGRSQVGICKNTKLNCGANKCCCDLGDGVGFCLNKAHESPINIRVGKQMVKRDSIDRELANLETLSEYTINIDNMSVANHSQKVKVPCPSNSKKACVGFFNEWVDGEFVHPVRTTDWGKGGVFDKAVVNGVELDNDAKATLGTSLGELGKKLGEKGLRIMDFQGAVKNDGSFVFADVGKMYGDYGIAQAKLLATSCKSLGGTDCPKL